MSRKRADRIRRRRRGPAMLSDEDVLALQKCEAAERFTTSPGLVRQEIYLSLQASRLIEWRNGFRLTNDGRRLLVDAITKKVK